MFIIIYILFGILLLLILFFIIGKFTLYIDDDWILSELHILEFEV